MDPFSREALSAAYDSVALDYVRAFGDDLASLPVDRTMLNALARASPTGGLALDLGCGPGTVGAYLKARGLSVVGLDVSPRMLSIARLRAGLPGVQGDMRSLPFGRDAFSLVVAFYAIHHVPRSEFGLVLSEIRRVLAPMGHFLLATHLGKGEVFSREFLGHEIASVGGTLYARDELSHMLVSAGFDIRVERLRHPLPHEYPSERLYLAARHYGEQSG